MTVARESVSLRVYPLLYDPGDGAVVCYDPASGDTHLISAEARAFLDDLLRQRTVDRQVLIERVAAQLADSDAINRLAAVLEELEQLGIVSRAA